MAEWWENLPPCPLCGAPADWDDWECDNGDGHRVARCSAGDKCAFKGWVVPVAAWRQFGEEQARVIKVNDDCKSCPFWRRGSKDFIIWCGALDRETREFGIPEWCLLRKGKIVVIG